jgi:aspartate/methionine/tyrosine aminotransferase
MPAFTLPDGTHINTTATEYSTQLQHYFMEHGHDIVDAGRGNPGGYKASMAGLQAGIEHLKAKKTAGDGTAYSGGAYKESKACTRDLDMLFGTKRFFEKDGLFFSTGEIEALNALSQSLSGSIVITPYPHYVNYSEVFSGKDGKAGLYPVLHENKNLVKRLKGVVDTGANVSAILICDPNNPTGSKLSVEEWRNLFEIIKEHPHIKLIMDFAYYGLVNDWQDSDGKKKLVVEPLKILQEEYPEIKNNIVTLFSATKVGGLFDERPSVSYVPDANLLKRMVEYRTHTTFEPASTTVAICTGIVKELAETSRLSEMSAYYAERAKMLEGTLQELGVLTHSWQGGLYLTADLSGLYGSELSKEAAAWVGHNTIRSDSAILASLAYPKDKNQVGILASLVDPQRGNTGLIRFCASIEHLEDMRKMQGTLLSLKGSLRTVDKAAIAGQIPGFL